jgi:uncharacterized OB-fold protein
VGEPTPPGTQDDVGPTRRYQDALCQGRLEHQRCGQCGLAVFPPRVLCPLCSAEALHWKPSAGAGTVYSASTLAPRDEDPYTVVLVDLDEGFRVMSVIAGAHAPLGARVRLTAQPPADPAAEPRLVAVLASGPDE